MYFTETPYIEFISNKYTDPLIENWEKIRDEYWANCIREGFINETGWVSKSDIVTKPNGASKTNFPGLMLYEGNIKGITLMIRDSLLDDREKENANWKPNEKIRWWPNRLEVMPILKKHITDNYEIYGSFTFNTMMPSAKLNYHWGLDSAYLRLHLCIDEASNCVFNIEGWEKPWKDGEIFGFDDANVLHGTKHLGSKPRTILLIDIKKEVIKPFCKNWAVRDKRPDRKYWETIKSQYLNPRRI